jgi:hypothetical protein
MKRILLTAAAGAAAVAGALALAAPAMASNGVTAVTHSAGHLDTTSVAGPATQPSPGGPVWALDNMSEHFTAVPDGPGRYSVTIDVTGSFAGFANPRTADEMTAARLTGTPGGPLDSHGSVKGTITYEVSALNGLDKSALPAQEPDGTGIRTALLQLFPGGAIVGGGDHYNFTYNQVGGAPYSQQA